MIADVYKVFGMLVRRDGTTKADMRKYYENKHVPLILSLAPPPDTYKRNYVLGDNDNGPDVITELVFSDRQAYEQWVAVMYAPDSGVAEDEARFLNRGRTTSYCVEECS